MAMKTLCLTGASHTALTPIAEYLYTSGLAPAQTLERTPPISFTRWHQHVTPTLKAGKPVGKLWEQVASDLLLANLESEAWGWHDPQSLWALDFWAELDPNIHFVLLISRPERHLADCLLSDHSQHSANECVDHWREQHQHMLDFYLQHAERCVLLDSEAIQAAPNALIEQLSQRWGLPLAAKDGQNSLNRDTHTDADTLALYIAQQLVNQQRDAIRPLYQELQAAQLPLRELASGLEEDSTDTDGTIDLGALVKNYQTLHYQSDVTRNELKHQQTENQRLNTALVAEKSERETLQKRLQQAENTIADAQQSEAQKTSELEETKQEAELLLLQLHQVQEELESTFLKQQTLEKQQSTLDASYQQAQKEREKLKQERDQAEQQRHSLQQQLEKASTAQSQAQQSEAQKASELEETKQEAELLLLQLHQVQEELEHYFLEHQKLYQRNSELEPRWQRLLHRHPDLLDVAQITYRTDDNQRYWEANELLIAGRQFEHLAITTVQHGKGLNIYVPSAQLTTPLETDMLALEAPLSQDSWQQLQQLTSQDWKLITQLPTLLQQGAQQNLDGQEQASFSYYLAAWDQAFKQFPAILRVDDIALRKEQVNPDYEHLWLDLEGITLGNDRHDRWSVRIASNDPQQHGLGQHFKLEIPEQPSEWLEEWYAESEDETGAKWELRFALPDAMDTNVWQQLNERDQFKLKSLVAQLPTLLERLTPQTGISRPLSQWQQIAQHAQRILQQHG